MRKRQFTALGGWLLLFLLLCAVAVSGMAPQVWGGVVLLLVLPVGTWGMNFLLKEKLEAMSDLDIYQSAIKLFTSFESEVNLRLLENIGRTRLTIQQYCQLIGRLRLYQVLPLSEQKKLP